MRSFHSRYEKRAGGPDKRKELGSALFSGIRGSPIVAAAELNFRVRDGAGCGLRAIAAELFPS